MQETVIQVLLVMILIVASVLLVMSWQALRRSLRRRRPLDQAWPTAGPRPAAVADPHAAALGKR